MTAQYEIRLYNTSGVQIALLDDWRSLTIERRLNDFSTHQLSIDAHDPKAYLFTLDTIVEVLRADPMHSLSRYREYIGFHRTPQFNVSTDGYYIFTSYGRSLEDLLHRRSLLYRAPYEKSGYADDVMKAFVTENAGPSALTSNDRTVDGVTPGLSIQGPSSQADTWIGQRSWRNLLEIIKEISLANGVDFSVEYTGPAQFEFRTYWPQKGVDRTQSSGLVPHVFSIDNANIAQPSHVHSRTEEITVVSVQGSGEEAARSIVVVKDEAAVAESPWNHIELARDARNEATDAAMEAVGRAELERLLTDENFTFEALQTSQSVYGLHYTLGDLVTVQLRIVDTNNVVHDIVMDKKIVEVRITVSEGKENITLRTGTLIPIGIREEVAEAFKNVIRRVQVVENSGAI